MTAEANNLIVGRFFNNQHKTTVIIIISHEKYIQTQFFVQIFEFQMSMKLRYFYEE